jgi:hypothetical protein
VRSPELRVTFCNDITWSYDKVMDSISDPNLRTEVVNSLSAYPEHKHNGVLAFFFLQENIAKFRKDQGAELCKALYEVALSSIPGYNVNSYVTLFCTVSDVLHMRGVDLSDAKEHIIKQLRTAPNESFKLDIHLFNHDNTSASYERLLEEGVTLYHKYKSDWATQTKTGAVFLGAVSAAPARLAPPPSNLRGGTRAGAPTRARSRTPNRRPANASRPNAPRSNAPPGRKTHDFQGNPIDYNAPPPGASHTRGTGPNDKWCGHERCQRWGSHLTHEHAQWYANLKQRSSRNRRPNDRASNRPSGPPPSTAANDAALQMPRSHLMSHF